MPSGMTHGGSGKTTVNAADARREEALGRILASMSGWFGDYVRNQLAGGPPAIPGGGFMGAGLNQGAIPGGGYLPPGPVPGSIPGGGFMPPGLNRSAIPGGGFMPPGINPGVAPGGGYMPPAPPPSGMGRSTGNAVLDLLELIGGQGR